MVGVGMDILGGGVKFVYFFSWRWRGEYFNLICVVYCWFCLLLSGFCGYKVNVGEVSKFLGFGIYDGGCFYEWFVSRRCVVLCVVL